MSNKLKSGKHVNFNNPDDVESFIGGIKDELNETIKNPIMLQGHQKQALFEAIAVTLGKCEFIKTEDFGNVYVKKGADIKPPDFRVILEDGFKLFIEVKNKHQKNFEEKFEVNENYLKRLISYSSKFDSALYFAIYWSRQHRWTLVAANKLTQKGTKFVISWQDAEFANEMYRLGDVMIATLPPLTFKIITDPSKSRYIQEDGLTGFSITDIELFCGGEMIIDPEEREIASFLSLYSDWILEEPFVEVQNNELISITFNTVPEDSDPQRNFQILGFLSGLISRQFHIITAPEGSIENISPYNGLKNLGVIIPENYKGKALKLWVFKLLPRNAN